MNTPARDGFTLIELAVVLTISALVIAIAEALLGTALTYRDRTNTDQRELAGTVALRTLLEEWIGGSTLSGAKDDEWRDVRSEQNGVSNDELEFFTRADSPVGAGGTDVRFWLGQRAHSEPIGLVMRMTHRQSGTVQNFILDTSVTSIVIETLASRDSVTQWRRGWISGTALPIAVRISLKSNRFDDAGALLQLPILAVLKTR